MKLKSIKDIQNLKGKKVLVRVDFNVPLVNGRVRDDFRIEKTMPTISYLQKKGARVILISHIGSDGSQSLVPVAKHIQKSMPIKFVKKTIGAEAEQAIDGLKNGEVLLLENLRAEEGEAANSAAFAKKLASYADVYVNDAFPVAHRKQASVVGVPKYIPSYAGLQLAKETAELANIFNPKHPFLVILGGAKFETKLPLIKRFLKTADHVFVAGALVNEFFEEEGFETGKSLVDERNFKLLPLLKNKKLLLPPDVLVVDQKTKKERVTTPSQIGKNEMIVDIGPKSLELLHSLIAESKMVLWNGPTGNYENGYDKATLAVLKMLAEAKAHSVVGGGDTVALVSKRKLEDRLGFVSTGGGATLDYLADEMLPGLKPLLA